MVYNFENYLILFVCVVFLLFMNIMGYAKLRAWYPMVALIFFMASLIVHIIRRDILGDVFTFNAYIDLACIAVSITNFLITDEIETRREVIKVVFENRYKD